MGFLAAVGDGLASGMEQGVKDIEQESRFKQAMQMFKERMEMESGQRRADDEYAWNKRKERAPEETRMATEKETAVSRAREMAKLDPEVNAARRSIEAEDSKAKVANDLATLKDRVKILRAETEAKTNPTERAAASLRLKEAEIKLAEAEEGQKGRAKVKGLLSAADSVDMSQPGGESSRDFYRAEAQRANQDNKIVAGADNQYRGQIKVMKDRNGEDIAVMDDGKGGVFRIDPETLQKFGDKSGKGGKVFPTSKLADYARLKGVSEDQARSALEAAGWKIQ